MTRHHTDVIYSHLVPLLIHKLRNQAGEDNREVIYKKKKKQKTGNRAVRGWQLVSLLTKLISYETATKGTLSTRS